MDFYYELEKCSSVAAIQLAYQKALQTVGSKNNIFGHRLLFISFHSRNSYLR